MKSIADIKAIRDKMQSEILIRDNNHVATDVSKRHVLVCGGTGCTSNHSGDILNEFHKLLAEHGLENDVNMVRTGCFGLCAVGPVVIIYPEGAFYTFVQVDDVKELVEEHLIKGNIVTLPALSISSLSTLSCFLALLGHKSVKGFLIQGHSFFHQNILG